MVNHLGGRHSPFELAVAAKRIGSQVAQPNLLPFIAVTALGCRALPCAPRAWRDRIDPACHSCKSRFQGGQATHCKPIMFPHQLEIPMATRKKAESFAVVSDTGKRHAITRYVSIIQTGTFDDPHSTREGLSEYRLEDGSAVNKLTETEFETLRGSRLTRI